MIYWRGHIGFIRSIGVITYGRTGMIFNPQTEKFVKDKEADKFLTREYRKPYIMPENI
jgi:hypothetical protein